MPIRSSLCLMASMVRDRAVSPVELVDAHLDQIAAQNPRLNAFVAVLADRARAAARQAEAAVMRGEPLGLLHGVPVTVKDSIDMAGLPTVCGSLQRVNAKAAADATTVARLRAAGAIILGKTNCPEFLWMYETDNNVTGLTRNPWNLDRTPGGSSGGESAAIAAFCSAGGLGSDGGGSVRIPAHFCGIAALKPTPGRVSGAGHFPKVGYPGGLLGVVGPMARTATDLRLMFAALAGHDPADPFSAPVPLRPPAIHGLRVGVLERFNGVPVHDAIRAAVRAAAAKLHEIGIAAEPFEPQGLERAPNVWWFFFGRLPAPFVKQMIEGHEERTHWSCTEFLGKALSEPAATAADVVTQLALRDSMRAALLEQMEQYPILLTPACGVPAFPHRERRYNVEGREIGLFQAMMPATFVNALGLPAATIPFGFTEDGLPVGIQVVGRPWEEELVLDVAVRLEEARGAFPGPPV